MAGSYVYKNQDEQYSYISEIFNTLIIRDIFQKHNIRNTQILSKLNDFLLDNISSEVSARKISDTLTSNN